MKKKKRKRAKLQTTIAVSLKDLARLRALVIRALDTGTEFGIENASRERLLVIHGELVMGLRFVREQLPDTALPGFVRRLRRHRWRSHRRR